MDSIKDPITNKGRAKKINKKKKRNTALKASSVSTKPGLTLKRKRSTSSFTASVDANRSDSAKATLNTLSMISTPWSTESGFTDSQNLSQILSSLSARETNFSTTSVDPLTTTASSGLPSLTSKETITLLVASTPSSSEPIYVADKYQTDTTLNSWTMETFTSPGLLSTTSRIISVGHAWSPVYSSEDFYPCSSDTLTSRKGSRYIVTPSIASSTKTYFPINYIKYITLSDDHPGLDWTFAKQHCIPTVISIPI